MPTPGAITPTAAAAGSVAVTGTGLGGAVTWLIAEETPVAFEYNGRSHAVMMATPADLEDFALGFSLCEGIVAEPADIERVTVRRAPGGIVLDIRADAMRLVSGSLRTRSMEGRSGCGLCGVDSLANAMRQPRPVSATVRPPAGAVAAAFAGLADHQPMTRANRSVHAAAWCDPGGRIVLAREDVGRHNALDKLAGALATAGIEPAAGFVVMSSRCSFELVQKAATLGVPLLATLSAPTALALDLARAAGMTLAARAPGDGVILF